ncbi:MAG: hypothetical protein R8G66_23120 [Cytophagales bacterium]|nr:hypothetical protein [Cytophagales bacterium]
MKRLLFLSLLLSPVLSFAQGFVLGLNPTSMKWDQIDTDKVQVIYPQGMDNHAQRAANIIHMLYDSSFYSLGDKQGKVSIILQNQTTVSNGFVTVSPFRSEFFTTPPQFNFLGAASWWDFLTIHEYRHVEQFLNAKRGITKINSIIFGQNGWGGASVLALPRWYFEGDATYYETALTTAGRGRTPDFDKLYRSLLLDGKFYNYEKASATSIKDFVPNHYNLGYYMVTHVRNKYGDDAFTQATQDAANYKGILYPFSRGLKRGIGLRTPQLYKETFSTLQKEWEIEKSTIEVTPSSRINASKKRAFTSYTNPVFLNDNLILVEKAGFQDIMQYVQIEMGGREKRIYTPGRFIPFNSNLSVGRNKIVWAEMAFDERWGNQDFSIIRTYDMESKKRKTLKTRTKYFAPTYSPDGTKIAAVQIPETAQSELHILQDETGYLIGKVPNPENYQISFPSWVDDQNVVVALTHQSKTAIAKINLESNEYTMVKNWTTEQLSYPYAWGDYIFFNSTVSGIDNVHAVNTETGAEYQVTSTLYGAKQVTVSPNGKKIAYSEFTSEGWNLQVADMDPGSWKAVQASYATEIDFIDPTLDYTNILDRVPEEKFEKKKFNKSSGFLNVHSWSPILLHPNYGGIVYASNVFSTFGAAASYQYNVNEEKGRFSAGVLYGELYPVLQFGYSTGDRQRATRIFEEDLDRSRADSIRSLAFSEWEEQDAFFAVRLPLNLSAGNHFANMEVKGAYHYLQIDDFTDVVPLFSGRSVSYNQVSSNFSAIELSSEFSRFQRTARQNVIPRWGQLLTVTYEKTFGSELYQGEYFQVDGRLLFPGLLKTHGTALRFNYRQEDLRDTYKFRDNFFYARGYNAQLSDEVLRVGFDYSLPLWLPDIALGPFAFIQRVKATAFFDYMRTTVNDHPITSLRPLSRVSFEGTFPGFSETFGSVGADIRFDFRFLRMLDVDMGFRYSYLLDDVTGEPHQFDLIIASLGF